MSTTPPIISYASPPAGQCPLCQSRPVGGKAIYHVPVCKKCFYRFTNRRQLGFLIDSVLQAAAAFVLGAAIVYLLNSPALPALQEQLLILAIAVPLNMLFTLKDGFSGQSPGKWLANIQVVDNTTQKPIGFGQSFMRNAIFLVGLIPIVGGLMSLGVIIALAIMVGKGYRWGDKLANTRAIWKRYAHTTVFNTNPEMCTGCGYNLYANTSGICPECGKPVPNHPAMAVAGV